MLKLIRKAGYVLMIFALMVSLCPTALAGSGTQTQNGRKIAFVLDNSGSMIVDPNSDKYCSRWAEATHALKTFLYMVNEEDRVGLFTVGRSFESNASDSDHRDAATISKDLKKGNIEEELKNVGISPVTYTYGMEAAYEWVKEGNAEERWVVILSDGMFYEGRDELTFSESVGKQVEETGAGVRTIFIGLDFGDIAYDGRFGSLLTVYKTSRDGQGIEDTILGISNDIYQMESFSADDLQTLGEFSYDNLSGTLTWDTQPGLSSYLSRVIIIAQTHDELEAEQGVPVDPRIKMISSDNSFSWCREGKLKTVLDKYNGGLTEDSDYKIISEKDFRAKIKETFLGKRCYIGTYSGNQLGERIEFQTPPGTYTYRIYYELRDDIVPELVVKQNGTELAADFTKNFFVTEGLTELDYCLKVGDTEIPRDFLVIAPKLSELRVEGTADRTPEGLYDFSYRDAGENDYPVRMSFQGMERVQTVQVGVDIKRYLFRIQEDQKLNIDRAEDWLTIETQLPPVWLEEHLKGHLQMSADRDGLQFNVQEYNIQSSGDRSLIRVPVSFDGELDLTQEFLVTAVLMTDGGASIEAEQAIELDQDRPEIISMLPSKLSWLGIPMRNEIPVAEISAKIGEDVVEGVSIEDAKVAGLGMLEGARLRYDDQTKQIFLSAGPRWAWKLLSSGKGQGDVMLSGAVYRNGAETDPPLECKVTVVWKGTLGWFIAFRAVILLLLVIAASGALIAKNGLMLIRESFVPLSSRWKGVQAFFQNWKSGSENYEVFRSHGIKTLPWKITIKMPDEEGFFVIIPDVTVVLRGTKTGYKMDDTSIEQLHQKGVAVDRATLDYTHPITFTCGGMTCILENTRRRNPLADMAIWLGFWLAVIAIYILMLVFLV